MTDVDAGSSQQACRPLLSLQQGLLVRTWQSWMLDCTSSANSSLPICVILSGIPAHKIKFAMLSDRAMRLPVIMLRELSLCHGAFVCLKLITWTASCMPIYYRTACHSAGPTTQRILGRSPESSSGRFWRASRMSSRSSTWYSSRSLRAFMSATRLWCRVWGKYLQYEQIAANSASDAAADAPTTGQNMLGCSSAQSTLAAFIH